MGMTSLNRRTASVTLAAIVLALLLASSSTAQQHEAKPAEALATMLKAQVSGPEWLLSKGYNDNINARNWHRLANKLATPGSKIQVVTFGGSVTAGHLAGLWNCSWVEQLEVWLHAAFPTVRFEVLNLARGSTVVTAASTCWYQHIPSNADLVFIEYSANGCDSLRCTSITSPLVADYESLLRRVIRRAPGAALMSFAIFSYATFRDVTQHTANATLPIPWYSTGGDMHAVLAGRYGVPMVSARNALYDIMWDNAALQSALGYTRAQIMVGDIHPSCIGEDLYGRGLVAWGMRYILTRELSKLLSTRKLDSLDAASYTDAEMAAVMMGQDASNSDEAHTWRSGGSAAALPPAVSPVAAREADGDTFCAEGAWLPNYVVQSSVRAHGWKWIDGSTPNSQRYCLHFNCRRFGYTATGAQKSLDILVDSNNVTTVSRLEKRALVVFFTRDATPGRQGIAQVSCVSGCSCTPIELDGNHDMEVSILGTGSTQVTPHPQCLVRVTILDKTNSGGWTFKVDGVAVVPYTDANSMTPVDYLALHRPTRSERRN